MVPIALVLDKTRRLGETIASLRNCLPGDPGVLAGSRDARDLVSFRVYLAMQESIDVAAHLIADQGWGPTPSLREHFAVLANHGVLEPALAAALSAGVKVRNLIGHAYAEVDPVKLHAAAAELLRVVPLYVAALVGFAERSAGKTA